MSLHRDTRAVLDGWTAPSPEEELLRQEFLSHLDAHEDAMWRQCGSGHITATTAVVSADGARVLLTLHRKAGMWLPMGGHCEISDMSLAQAALREASEESGIHGLVLLGGPLALDRHRGWCRPPYGTWHFDVEYGAVAPPDAEAVISDESLDLRWFPVEQIPEPSDDATRRLARRAQAWLTARC